MYITLPLLSLGLLALTASANPVPDHSKSTTRWMDPEELAHGLDLARRDDSSNATNPNKPKNSKKWKHFDCGTNSSQADKTFLDVSKKLHAKKKNGVKDGSYNYRRDAAPDPAPATSIVVDTYFHIVTHPSEAGSITPDMAVQQSQVLNNMYNPYGIHFNLKNTSFTTNDAWAVGATDADDMAMKNALRQGTYASLNIYFQTDLAGNVLGKCTLPAQIVGTVPPSAYANDGCNINAWTMPGGSIDDYNQGQTAVHESGHWLGLMHVFEGYSCDPNNQGDMIADTPQQAISTDGCPTSPPQDSCPGLPGVDSIHNVMDYSYDSCYQGLTAGQVERILTLWPQFRQGH